MTLVPDSRRRPSGESPAGRSTSRREQQSAADRAEAAAPGEETAPDGVLTERSARIAAAHRLLRRPRRVEAGEFLVEGAQAVTEAVDHERRTPGTVLELYLTEQAARRDVDLVRAAYAAKIPVTQVTERAAAALSDTVKPQGLVARCRLLTYDLDAVLAAAPRLIAVLVQTNDPGNAGTVIRLADAAGADAVIVAGDAVDVYNPKVVRATAGSLFHLPVVRAADPVDLVQLLSSSGLSVLATTGSAELDLDTARADGILELPTAWLFGSEAHGLPDDVLSAADERVRVPIHGRAESLNLATAAAVCLYASATAQRAG